MRLGKLSLRPNILLCSGEMRTLLICLFLAAPTLHGAVIFLGSPSFGALPSSTGCNSFFPSLVLAPTANGFFVTGTVQIQLSGPTASIRSVTWSASVLVLITQGFVTVDGTIDASLSMPADVPTLAAASTPGS